MNPPQESGRIQINSAERNYHHGLAESLGGQRRVQVGAQEHASYHQALGHQPPCMVIRRLVYAAVKRNGYSVTVDTASQLLEILTPDDWRDLYKPDAILDLHPKGEKKRTDAALAAYHLRRYLDAERSEITLAIGRLSGLDETNNMRSATVFFRACNPLVAIHRMVTEGAGKKRNAWFKWVDPLKEDIRKAVELHTEKPELERLTRQRREMMIALFNIQDSRIGEYQSSAKPSLREYSDVLAKSGDQGKVDMNHID